VSLYITGRLEEILTETIQQAGKLGYYHCSRLGLCLAVVGCRTVTLCHGLSLCPESFQPRAAEVTRRPTFGPRYCDKRHSNLLILSAFLWCRSILSTQSAMSYTSDCHPCDRRYTPGLPSCYASGSTEMWPSPNELSDIARDVCGRLSYCQADCSRLVDHTLTIQGRYSRRQ
jgi:hypothetical protein